MEKNAERKVKDLEREKEVKKGKILRKEEMAKLDGKYKEKRKNGGRTVIYNEMGIAKEGKEIKDLKKRKKTKRI